LKRACSVARAPVPSSSWPDRSTHTFVLERLCPLRTRRRPLRQARGGKDNNSTLAWPRSSSSCADISATVAAESSAQPCSAAVAAAAASSPAAAGAAAASDASDAVAAAAAAAASASRSKPESRSASLAWR
jgi:hypothetical protein